MFQSPAESEGVQPNHSNNMPNSISEEPINRLPSNSGGSANQSQLFFMPNSSSEEPIHQLPSNLGGSSQQPQLSEAQNHMMFQEGEEAESEGGQRNQSNHIMSQEGEEAESEGGQRNQLNHIMFPEGEEAESEGGQRNQSNSSSGGIAHQSDDSQSDDRTAAHLNYYRPLYKAAQSGDWKTAKSFIDSDPNALTTQISTYLETVLHIAARCCQWKFVLMLLELDVSTPQSIAVQDAEGGTVLHIVAEGGSLKTAKALLEKNANLLQMDNKEGKLPLLSATYSKNKELVWYLSFMTTRVEYLNSPFFIPQLPKILHHLIQAGYHDIALYFIQRFPHVALAEDEYGNSLLFWLANNPSYFFSGSKLGFFQKWIYKFVRVEIKTAPTHSLALQSRSYTTQVCTEIVLGWFKRLLWKAITQLESPVSIMYVAIENGIEEIVRTLLKDFPDLTFVWVRHQRNILQAATECRQENIVNIIKEFSPMTTRALCSDNFENINTLHLAGKLAPDFKLHSVSGAALQMQRELQWFKEVEMYTVPANIGIKDSNNQTAKDVFRLAHKELSKDGEKWMKDTANSCMLVSTLIATVLFAAAFTVPGGNVNDKGIPIFLRSKAFTVFAISNTLGLFSSLTSLLMFLAILTARYAVDDFLESLPKKLIIGLGSLFFAIAAMIIAFGAALTIILNERWHLVYVPITLVASLPVAIFVMLQLPLFVQMVQSTYGASIFRPWPSKKFE